MSGVHRHVTDDERARYPDATTFNRAAGTYHRADGCEVKEKRAAPVVIGIDQSGTDDEFEEWLSRFGASQ